MEFDAETQRWYTANPLWKWRIANRRDAREVEDGAGLPRGRVEALEMTTAVPSGSELRKLARLTGIADLNAQWAAWQAGRHSSGSGVS